MTDDELTAFIENLDACDAGDSSADAFRRAIESLQARRRLLCSPAHAWDRGLPGLVSALDGAIGFLELKARESRLSI
ncbi:hypothetical protein [Variovorax sp.]|uniref:hypothetical protein n=1 Tax=Variovorax sp. TaxID=1871043 RepID=UPI002D3B8034|nr:hypothetical protein [Variovorax sp.]HYP82986.1 hypothetical protein [Variovorax sp.]